MINIKLTEDEKWIKANRKRQKEIAALDMHGNKVVDTCSRCGAINVPSHKHYPTMCIECGKLYGRWKKAVRNNIQSELRRLKPILLQRYERLLKTDKDTASRCETFYKRVEQTEVTEMKQSIITHKACKQCGRDLDIERFRKYKPRGRGAYETSTGYYTICKDCESISNRAAAALKKGDEETLKLLREHYQTLSDKGLPLVTAAARRVLGVDDVVGHNSTFVGLLQRVSGRGGDGLAHDSDTVLLNNDMPDIELSKHCEKIRNREYTCADDAYEAHRRLTARFSSEELLSEMNALIEEWYDDEENADG